MSKLFIALIITSSFAAIQAQEAINHCITEQCYRCDSVTNTVNKQCSRCVDSKSILKDSLGACQVLTLSNCVFYHWHGSSHTGCHRCAIGYKTVYADVEGKKDGTCVLVGSDGVTNCAIHDTNPDDNSVKCYYCEEGYVPNVAGSACEAINGTTVVGKANCKVHRRHNDLVSCKYCKIGYGRQGDFDCVPTDIEGCLRVEDDDATMCKECRFFENWWAVSHTTALGSVCEKKAYLVSISIISLIVGLLIK